VLVYLKTGSMNIGEIISYQAVNGPLAFSIPLAAIMFFLLLFQMESMEILIIITRKTL